MEVTIATKVTFDIEECIDCGVLFGVTQSYQKERREDHKGFHCPNGHSQHYPGLTPAEKLAKQLDAEKARVQFWQQEADRKATALKEAQAEAKRVAARAKNGVCPCCNRSFVQLQRHMTTKHPEYAKS